MIQAFVDDVDLHTRTAANLFKKEDKDVTKDERAKGKGLNFTLGYDGTASALYKNYGIPFEEGEKLIEQFMTVAYPDLGRFKKALGEAIWEKGFARTPLGRKRFFRKPLMYKDSRELERYKAKTLRELGNHCTGQGPGADILKLALCRLYYENPFGEENYKIILDVYDEIVIEVKENIGMEAKEFTERIMKEEEQKFLGKVPAKVETALTKDGQLPKYWIK